VNVQRIPHTRCHERHDRRTQLWLVVAAVIRLKMIVDFLFAGIREDYWKGTPAVPTVLLCM